LASINESTTLDDTEEDCDTPQPENRSQCHDLPKHQAPIINRGNQRGILEIGSPQLGLDKLHKKTDHEFQTP
jgi:hypothetical protein